MNTTTLGAALAGAAVTNQAFSRAELEKEIKDFGKAYGQGQNSRPSMALRCVEAAHKLSDVGPDDAEDLYTRFQQAAAKARGIEYSAESSFKVQVSKVKRFLMLGALPQVDGVDIMNRVTDIIEKLSRMAESPLKGSAYDNMVGCARLQLESPTVPLTDDQITEHLSAQTEEKTALDKVIDLYKKSYRLGDTLREEGIDPQYIDDATENLATQIKHMDGELPPMTKEDKAKAAAFKVLKDQGIKLVPAGAAIAAE